MSEKPISLYTKLSLKIVGDILLKALFVKLEDELNEKLEKHVQEYNLKKAHVTRDALSEWLKENGENDSTRESSGMEADVSASELGTQQAA